ncbi:calcium-binding protein [Fuscovulum ytuae]|uniref:Calcium-binding protein n=1 Tax=Fuscovulum ytuae TaxID=3042299 RepID=A0ABY8Q6J9_9RHOB|nr:hypothetical protein [Fuscovulum sp. YMD61]WGV15940.1 hypothetical protein QF092_17065 [Fuscovulum sp. YMD61]
MPPLLPPEGLTDPTLALGLSGLADWGSARPFIDQMLTARPWFGAAEGDWETMKHADLVAGGYVDEDGWVTRLPPGIKVIRTIWAYGKSTARERAGTYILTYEGEGRVRLGGDARKIDGRPGRIVFSTEGGTFWLDLFDLDPRGIGRPIRNISIVQDKHQALHEAGVIFRPEWIDSIKDSRLIRFMDWAATNGSRVVPGEVPLIDARGLWRMKGRGAPVSLMVELANQIGADPWFCMPHMADDAYVRAFAEYVYTNLNPDIVAHVEYSNEVWNEAFSQGRWVREQAAATWGVPYGHEGGLAFIAREATRDALIWEDVYGTDATLRLNNVLATQALNTWATGLLLTPNAWIGAESETYLPAGAVFDSLAVTTYFGARIMASESTRSELVSRVKDDPIAARKWLIEQISNPANPDTPGSNRRNLEEQKALATTHGLALVAYEGGQHVHHSFAVPGLTDADIQAVTKFMIDFVRGPEMAKITEENWNIWKEIGDGPYMHFGDSGAGGRSGSFSLVDAPGISNPTADLLHQLNQSTPSWWGDPGGTRYQQGRRIDGNERDNALSGTIRGDVILAGAGDDLLNPGPGLDHLHGGDGTDTVILPDPAKSITFEFDGPRTIARGPSGRWHLFSVERIRFPDGTEIDTPTP